MILSSYKKELFSNFLKTFTNEQQAIAGDSFILDRISIYINFEADL